MFPAKVAVIGFVVGASLIASREFAKVVFDTSTFGSSYPYVYTDDVTILSTFFPSLANFFASSNPFKSWLKNKPTWRSPEDSKGICPFGLNLTVVIPSGKATLSAASPLRSDTSPIFFSVPFATEYTSKVNVDFNPKLSGLFW